MAPQKYTDDGDVDIEGRGSDERDRLLPLPKSSKYHSNKPAKHTRNRSISMDESLTSSNILRLRQQADSVGRAISASVRPITDSIRDGALGVEFANIREALGDHLHEADNDEDFFLEMNLTKNMSILPDKKAIVGAVEEMRDALHLSKRPLTAEVGEDEDEEGVKGAPLKEPEAAHIPLSAYLTLASAVAALSSIGPFLAAQKGVDAEMKIVWRFQGTALLLAPFAIRELVVSGIPPLSIAQWGTFLLAAASYSVLCVAFAMSIQFTTVSNATILTNSQSILLVAGKMLVGHQVVFLEGLGVFVAFTGAILAGKEAADAEDTDESALLSLWGDALGIISSIGGIGYIVLGKSLRSTMPVLLFMVLNMAVASILILLFMLANGKDISLDRHVNHGVWGWMNLQPDRLPLELATVFVCNVLGTMGYVRAFKYFSSLIIAVAALMEPVVAAFTAVAMGVGVLPGLEGWIGNVLVILGTLAVLYPTIERSNAAVGH